MTVKQAQAINDKFQALEDSIAQLTDDLSGCQTTVNFTQNKVEVTSEDLNRAKDSIVKLNKLYFIETKRQDKLEWLDKKARRIVNIGIGTAIVSWILFAFITIKQ